MERRGLHFLNYVLLVSLLCSLSTISAMAQINRANLNGTVTDPSGASVPNAKVVVVAPDTGFTRQATSTSSGVYSISSLPVGTYDLTISASGFKTYQTKGIDLSVGQTRTVNAQLVVGATTTTVEVKSSSQALATSNAEIATVIHPSQVGQIPINGRDWARLMTLAQGAINLGGGGQRDLRFGGQGIDDNNYTFDGLDATGVQEQSQKAGARLAISLESIAEFRVSSSVYTADQGGSSGAQVSVVSKTGTNQYHGTAFDFLRNNVFDARSPFDVDVPPFRLNQFGGSVGGPIRHNRTFFFADYEGLRQDLSTTLIGFVPNAAFRNQVAATSPALKPFLNSWPVGQTPVDSVTDQYTSIGKNTQREDSVMLRLDHTFNDKTSIFGRVNIDDATLNSPLDNLGGRDNPQIRPSNYVVQLTHVFSPTAINELRGGINRSALHHYQFGTCPLSTANGQPGDVCASSPSFDGPSNSTLDTEVGTTIDGYDDFTLVRGRHTIKTGIGVERHRLNNSSEGIANGALSYAADQDFINNVLDNYAFFGQLTLGGNRRTYIMPYVQDTFKVRSNLTLYYGLRWEHYTVLHEVFDRIAVVKPSCGGFCPKGTPLYFPSYKNFMPRLGVAWLPGGASGKTVIRAGYGIFFSPNQMDDFSDGHESTAERFSVSASSVPGLSWPVSLSLLPSPSFSPKAWDQNRKDGYVEQWNFTVQRALPFHFLGEVAYVGNEGHRLFSATKTNLINPLTGERALPQFGQYNLKANQGNSNFHSLQASLQRRLTSGWLWGTEYMWSHALSDNGFGAGEYPHIQNMACIKCDYSNSSHDVRQSLSVNSVYELPVGPGKPFINAGGVAGTLLGGWQLSGIAGATSGLPIDITVSRKASVMPDGNSSNQRPDFVSGMSLYPADQTINDWFNPAAFAVPAVGTWGTLGRYVGRGPSHLEIDTGLEKKTTITERLALDFRFEAFNMFNHPQYGTPGSNISKGSFGVITSQLNSGATGTGTSRRLQFMLRLDF
ncbi:MAG TPA: carboxypeptidase regulatory-like domain-containing protein [Terriglobia bacterium]|nr:carboxypeptidase regulatory-like domain-containing protein [Terriglobia bacterium]